jgi:hypothetical protein
MEVSPDGKTLAYLWSVDRRFAWGPEWITTKRTVYVHWCPWEDLTRERVLEVGSWARRELDSPLAGNVHLSFSPNSRNLAVVAPKNLFIIDRDTNEHWAVELSQEGLVRISSFAWLGEGCFGFVTHTQRNHGGGGRMVRTFWRQRMGPSAEPAAAIYQDEVPGDTIEAEVLEAKPWPLEYWSPGGRYVLCRSASKAEETWLLDVSMGKADALSPVGEAFRFAAWSPDESKAVWTTRERVEGTYRTYLLHVGDGRILDLTQGLREAGITGEPICDPLWTPDGRFVVGFDMKGGGYLIQPEPWEFRSLGDTLQKGMGVRGAVFVRRQQAPALLIARGAPEEFVVDYNGMVVDRLGSGGMSGWTLLPDGTKAAMRGLAGLVVRQVKTAPGK